ncbi:hypothetical protein CRUP_038513 [Coryphaenoides rupestris]|nr:hypothetical protein CRUP_038513 [Coryphaenoides rupestris]
MEKKGKFDYILLETTGLADPGAVASMFWVDAELGSDVYLDGIVTVVDAKYGLQNLLWEKMFHNKEGLPMTVIRLKGIVSLAGRNLDKDILLEQFTSTVVVQERRT